MTDKDSHFLITIKELLGMLFSIWFGPKLYSELPLVVAVVVVDGQ
jgi:hypothetical protein